jgi:two-component system sensor histidine kinase FlrB
MLGLDGRAPRDLPEVTRRSGVQLETFYRDETAGEAEQEFSHAGEEGKRWLGIRKRRLFAEADPEQSTAAQTILILRDITAHKQAEQEREAARKSVALAEVAALLAHEIRNPLASLELFAGLIADDPARRGEWTSHLRAGIRSLAGMVTNVLSFHSLGRMSRTPIDLVATIQAAVEFTRPIAEQTSLTLTFTCVEPGEAPVMLLANQGALQQVVLNLVSNAIRHTPPGGSIEVSVSTTGTRARVCFTDSGCGIAAEHIPNIFNPGFSGSGNSCGLGLAVCRQIATQHEGAISVLSERRQGTTFIVELPRL